MKGTRCVFYLILIATTVHRESSIHALELAGSYGERKNVEAFSNAMADIRAAEERCAHTFIDWAAVASWNQRLGIAGIDYSSYRHRARILLGNLADDTAAEAWCRDAVDRYGANGSSLSGMLRH